MEKWFYEKFRINFFHMKILTLIPIFNPQSSLFDSILPLLQHQSIDLELILINSGKEEINIANIKSIKISPSEFNHANTRNMALAYDTDYYLFMTQDAMPYDEYLIENLIKAFDDSSVVVAYARQIPYKDADITEVFARTSNYPSISNVKSKEDILSLGIKTFFNSDSCSMYRASYFKQVGGFTKDLKTNEDMEFAARAIMDGKKVAYIADAKVYHSHNFTYKDIWKRYRAIGKFFRENNWIVDIVKQYSHVESMGIKQAIAELKYLLKKSPLDIPRSIFVSLIKYIAYKI